MQPWVSCSRGYYGAERSQGRGRTIASGRCSRAYVPLISPEYLALSVVEHTKGESAIYLTQEDGERQRNFVGQSFLAREYFASTVGGDRSAIRDYIENPEKDDQ